MAELKKPAIADDAKKLLESALGGKTVEGLLDKTPLIFKGTVKEGLDKTINQIVETINTDPNKTSDSIIAALKQNQIIKDNIAALNKNKSAVGLTQDVSVDSIKPALEAFLKANKVEQTQTKSNDKTNEKPNPLPTNSPQFPNANATTNPTVTNSPTTTTVLTSEQQVAKAQEEAKLKEDADKKKNLTLQQAQANEKKNPLMEILKMFLNFIGLDGILGNDKQPAPTNQDTNNQTTPTPNSKDVALTTTTQPQPTIPVTPLNTPQAKQPATGQVRS